MPSFVKPGKIRGTLAERFVRYLDPDPITGCVFWRGSKNKRGYGQIQSGGPISSPRLAHRVAWELAGNKFEPGKELLHVCDNKDCVNVEHLVQASHRENIQMAARDGLMKGPKRFTNKEYDMVKLLKEQGHTQRAIALMMECSEAHISTILNKGYKNAYR